MRDPGKEWERSRSTSEDAAAIPGERVPGRRSLVEAELEGKHGRPSDGIPGKRTLAEHASGTAGARDDSSFESALAAAMHRAHELEAAVTAGDPARIGRARSALERDLAAAREHGATGSQDSLRGRFDRMLELIGYAEPLLARARSVGRARGSAASAGIQRRSAGAGSASPADPVATAQRGTAGAGSALPHLDQIQRSFGRHDVSSVKAHIGGAAAEASAELGASAYAHGDSVAFAGAPDLHTAAHEAAHVVQQRAGVSLYGGIDGGASDPYEQHADAVADRVVRGESAEHLLGSMASGSSRAAVQRHGGKDAKPEAAPVTLPAGVNMQVQSDGTVIARNSWLDSDPDRAATSDGIIVPHRMIEILRAFKDAGVLSWLQPGQIEGLSRKVEIAGARKAGSECSQFGVGFSVYALIGPPPDVEVAFVPDGGGLDVVVQQSVLVPGPVDHAKKVEVSHPVRQKIFTALERYTGLPITAAKKNVLVNGQFDWKLDVSPDQKGVTFWMSQAFLEKVYGHKEWTQHLENPAPKGGGGGLSSGRTKFADGVPEADRQYFLEWMKQVHGKGKGQATPYTVDADFIAELREIDKKGIKEKVLAKLNSGKGQGGQQLDLQGLKNAVNAVETEEAYAALGMAKPEFGKTYKPLYNEPIQGTIVNRGGLNYVGQETEFYFESQHVKDAFAIPDLYVRWIATAKDKPTEHLKVDTTHSIDLSDETPDYFSFEWPSVGIYTIHAFVSHVFYQSRHFEIDVEVKTEAQRTQELNGPAFAGLQGETDLEDKDHGFDVSWFNTAFGSHKEEYGKETWGRTPADFKRLSYEDRVKFLASDKQRLNEMIAAHKDSKDPRWADMISYAQDQLKELEATQSTLDKEHTDGATFFDARATYLSRQNGVPDATLRLLASAKKDGTTLSVTIHDLTQLTDQKNSTFTGSGSTWGEAVEDAFVHLCKSYPPGRVSALFEGLDDQAKPDGKTRGFEFDTGTAWKDVKSVIYNPKVQLAVNIVGAVTMIFFPPSAAILFPVLATYNSIDTIDHMAQLRERGNLTWMEVGKGVGQVGLNFLPYVGELKPVAQLGKIAMYSLDGVMIAGQTLIMTSDALERMRELRDKDVQEVADLDAKIRETERTNPSDPKLPEMRAQLDAAIKKAQDESTAAMQDMAKNLSFMLVQTAGLKALQSHMATKDLGALKREGIYHEQKGVDPHYDPTTGTIKGDASKSDPATLASLKNEYAIDMTAKRAELQKELGTENVTIERRGTKVKITKDGEGYKVELPVNRPFNEAIEEARKIRKASEHGAQKESSNGHGAGAQGGKHPDASTKTGLIDALAENKSLPEQHAHAQGSVPADAVFAERPEMTVEERAKQIADLKKIIGEVKNEEAVVISDLRSGKMSATGEVLTPKEKVVVVKAQKALDAEVGLVNQLYRAKQELNAAIQAGAPLRHVKQLQLEVDSALIEYQQHLTMRKPDYARYSMDVETGAEFFARYRMITGHNLTPREIADTRASAGQLGMQELRVAVPGKNMEPVRKLAKQVNQDNAARQAAGDQTDVSLILNTTKGRTGQAAGREGMAEVVDEWERNPELRKAVSGLDNAGVERADLPPSLLWKMSAKRAFMNAEIIRTELIEHLSPAERDGFIDSLARVLGTDKVAAKAKLEAFEKANFKAAKAEVDARDASDKIGEDGDGKITQSFAGMTMEDAATATRQMTDALRAHRAEVGDERQLPAQLGYTVHAGEQLKGMNPFELLKQVEEAIGLGADRIGHGLILGIDPEQLVQMGRLDPKDVPRFRARQTEVREHAKRAGVVIEMNITSNTQISNLTETEHPASEMVHDGVRVSVSTDDETTLGTTVREELRRLASAPGISRTDVATVILEGYYSRMGARPLADRARLKTEFFEKLTTGLSAPDKQALATTLADRFHTSVTEADPDTTIKRVLDAVFGTGG